MSSGADWLVGDVGKPKAQKKLQRAAEPLDVDDAVDFIEQADKDAGRLVADLKTAAKALDAIWTSGLTGEALVVLVQAKCGYCVNHGKNKPSTDVVQGVLEGLFRLGEYVR